MVTLRKSYCSYPARNYWLGLANIIKIRKRELDLVATMTRKVFRGDKANFINRLLKKKSMPILLRRCLSSIAFLFIAILGLYFQLTRIGYLPDANLLDILFLNSSESEGYLHVVPPGNNRLNYDREIAAVLGIANPDKSKISILIEKSQYRLTVYYDGKPIKSYPAVLGGNPTGDKLQEGDRRTPEGLFKIRDLYPHQSWSKFLWIDYPTKASWRQHLQAKKEGRLDWRATIGGEVGIHGVPEGADDWIEQGQNWTLGCISLKNKDVDELYQVVQVGTVVEVIP